MAWDIYLGYLCKKIFFRPNRSPISLLCFIDSIISKTLTFSSYALLNIRRPSRKTTVVPFLLTTITQRKDFI